MLYTYINRHAGTPDKTKQKRCSTLLNELIILYDNSAIEPYNSKGLQSRKQGTLQYCIEDRLAIIAIRSLKDRCVTIVSLTQVLV